mgnify:CR=1 FL=1
MFLIDDILLLPFKGLMGVLRKVGEMADRELSDADLIREKLMQLLLMFELDEISAEEYEIQERQLMVRLDAVQPK